MLNNDPSLMRVRILVKAYPQPSQKYGETVCVAAVSEDGSKMYRLYPVRYRRLSKPAQFDRYDLVEIRTEKPRNDPRPESLHVIEDSIKVIESGKAISDQSKLRLWRSHVAPSLKALQEENQTKRRSLGIIRPDPGSVKFFCKKKAEASEQDREISDFVMKQQSLFEEPLNPLRDSDYVFGYRYKSGEFPHEQVIHDWEVQAAYFNFQRLYGDDALAKLKQKYGEELPSHNLHIILGTMLAHPRTFIIIGLLRSSISLDDFQRQGDLF